MYQHWKQFSPHSCLILLMNLVDLVGCEHLQSSFFMVWILWFIYLTASQLCSRFLQNGCCWHSFPLLSSDCQAYIAAHWNHFLEMSCRARSSDLWPNGGASQSQISCTTTTADQLSWTWPAESLPMTLMLSTLQNSQCFSSVNIICRVNAQFKCLIVSQRWDRRSFTGGGAVTGNSAQRGDRKRMVKVQKIIRILLKVSVPESQFSHPAPWAHHVHVDWKKPSPI